ncbi:hypothetical protein QA597_10205 [Marinilabiliaceae bacterium ANBcel2]|nr:hypothetical protein [Marinilabiliaceae bacterium ANBcel2]
MKTKKTIHRLIIAVAIILTPAIAKADTPFTIKGDSHTKLGEYSITETESTNNSQKYILKYEDALHPIEITVTEKRRCTEYTVRSNIMEIQYKCEKDGFGATLLSDSSANLPKEINEMFLCHEQLGYQKRITTQQIELNEALGLIACYYPFLLKNIDNLYAGN